MRPRAAFRSRRRDRGEGRLGLRQPARATGKTFSLRQGSSDSCLYVYFLRQIRSHCLQRDGESCGAGQRSPSALGKCFTRRQCRFCASALETAREKHCVPTSGRKDHFVSAK